MWAWKLERGSAIKIGVDEGGKHSSRSSFQTYNVISPMIYTSIFIVYTPI
jgi:hypothetical protein